MQLNGGGSLVSTFSSFYPVTRVWYLHPSCQLIHKGSKSWLDSRLAELMGHLIERTRDQVKLFLGYSWFSHMDCLTCSVALQHEAMSVIWLFISCRLEYIRLGSNKDPTWRDFPQALSETRGVRQYVTLFETPFEASVLNDHENDALRAGSLLAVPPPPLGSQPLAGSTTVDLLGNSLTQWATHMQDVTSGMILPPEVVVNCPWADIVGVLNRLEGLTRVRYCRHCFGVGQKCRCSVIPHQAPGPTSALWTPPTVSYAAMIFSTETMASTSVAGVTHPSCPPPGMPPLEAMDTLLAPTTENLLASAGVGRGGRTQSQPRTPTAPGICQTRPMAPRQRAPASERQETNQATPYWQQVYPPQHTTGVGRTSPKLSTTPSTSQGCEEPAMEDKDTRGRSSSWGPWSRHRKNRSSTRGSRKHRLGIPSDDPMDEMSNYVASGWKRDLMYIIGCCWAAQVGSLDREEWGVTIRKFLAVMANQKAIEWTDIQELTPLQFMPYVANLFREVMGKDLQGLSQFTGWISLGGYYH